MSQSITITIANTTVRQDEAGRYLLNDLHRAAGGEPKHRPSRWFESKQTKELIAELEITGIPAITSKQRVGSFVCKELVYCYAMWISPAFSLKVIRAYDAQMTESPSVRPGQGEALRRERELSDPITPAELDALLARPVVISAAEYLALKSGAGNAPAAETRIPLTHYSDDQRAEVFDLANKGWMPAEISERTGIQRDTVHTMLFRARKKGLIPKGPRQGVLAREAKKGAAA